MKTIVIVLLACVVSPALADVYRCNSGSKTIYQDVPCPNAKVIDNTNGQAPSHDEQMRAVERAAREKALATQLSNDRYAEDQRTTINTTTSTIQTTVSPSPDNGKGKGKGKGKPNQRDRYYDRPDRYYDRPDRNTNRSAKRLDNRGQNDDVAGVTNNTEPNQTSSGNINDSANRDFETRTNAKRDYQKQKLPGFITHQPTDAHERDVYKQEMERQKTMDFNQ